MEEWLRGAMPTPLNEDEEDKKHKADDEHVKHNPWDFKKKNSVSPEARKYIVEVPKQSSEPEKNNHTIILKISMLQVMQPITFWGNPADFSNFRNFEDGLLPTKIEFFSEVRGR